MKNFYSGVENYLPDFDDYILPFTDDNERCNPGHEWEGTQPEEWRRQGTGRDNADEV